MQSIILLYIKETDGRPADGTIQSRIGWEEIEDAHGTPYALRAERNWRKTKYADAGRHGDIITDYNDLCCLFMRHVASRPVNITMSAFVIGETTNKHYTTLLKTRVWIVSSRNVLTGFESEASDCPCKVGIDPLYRNSLCASHHCRLTLLFQVQEIVLRKLRCTHSNIWVELFWNSVVNTT